MDEERVCSMCDEAIGEDDEFFVLDDGSIVCESCYEYNTEECGLCGGRFPEDDMEFFGDDIRICPKCFAREFPEVDVAANEAETTPAYEEMKRRLVGRKVADMVDETYEYDSGMDDDGYRYTFTVDIDKDGRISDISRLSKERCQAVWTTGESWHPCKVDPDDYEESGFVEDIIRIDLDLVDEDECDEDE